MVESDTHLDGQEARLQEYFAQKKHPTPRITIGPYAWSYCRVLREGGGYDRGTPVGFPRAVSGVRDA